MTNIVQLNELLDLEKQTNDLNREILAFIDARNSNLLVQSIALVLSLATVLEDLQDGNGESIDPGDFVYNILDRAHKETSQ